MKMTIWANNWDLIETIESKGASNKMFLNHSPNVQTAQLKSTQCTELAPNASQFTYQNLKYCKPHEKSKQKPPKG